ncbi:putative cytosolic Fe-S cluster assembly factor nubp1 [Gregarina niphandrodes]|uniref:Cytosolic Fe-S cluster assembly factor nubp1 n=1 Tax=Gregarina niphandrodes TaxID=110365 RepID=A0A023B5R5_GRENI|nr:putative cytosolic Fe-S cluster assembly factor nubp1 [Gregarina niphandrodes]EZG62791.1 putative cytosolic Fe-S cluster assembly factor nubp1 [Gregarina niphandrodes]|eukprot:XP_011130712.1 putative cytosolic Fe-S cluster assembly factor nubp1 [Gregarina niphandrodes]
MNLMWERRRTQATILTVLVAGVTLWWTYRHRQASKGVEVKAKVSDGGTDNSTGDVPENAPHGCPGVESAEAGHGDACQGCPNRAICASGQANEPNPDVKVIAEKLADIKNIILVLSGKGGVGKSTVSSQVAWELESRGLAVGILDIDICGPSIPRMTGTIGEEVRPYSGGWIPVVKSENLLVISVGYLLPEDDGAVIWRGPKKNGLIKQFLSDVYWGSLDYLIVDTPPGTSDEHLSIVTYLKDAGITGSIIVTTPQEISLQDVRKEINFCKQTQVPILGVVNNMANSFFSEIDPEGTSRMCEKMQVPYAGSIDLDKQLLRATEEGRKVESDSNASRQIKEVIDSCLSHIRPRS